MQYIPIIIIIIIVLSVFSKISKMEKNEIPNIPIVKKYALDSFSKWDNFLREKIKECNFYPFDNEYILQLVKAMIMVECSFDEYPKDSIYDNYGMGQISIDSCENIYTNCTYENLHKPEYNLEVMVNYISWIYNYYTAKTNTFATIESIIIGYNAGIRHIAEYYNNTFTLRDETVRYIEKVKLYLTPLN